MISKDELIKYVAEKCGITLEISSFFFEVFINRISNNLKLGEIVQFDNIGYFQRRNCRIQPEKFSDSPTTKAYLLQLLLFTSEQKVKGDFSSVHFLKIPNLKTLWVGDKAFENSLKAGDFYPHTEREQLIKSFATKAEIIIAGLRKDYDSELENELALPLTFDLNHLIKSGQKPSSIEATGFKEVSSKVDDAKKIIEQNNEPIGNALPWNYGTKFLDKEKTAKPIDDSQNKRPKDRDEENLLARRSSEIDEERTRPGDFEPVKSRLSSEAEEIVTNEIADTVKFHLGKTPAKEKDVKNSEEETFTEVKSKTGGYRDKDDWRSKESRSSGLEETRIRYQNYAKNRNYLPLIILFSFIIIAGAAIYFYFIHGDNSKDEGWIVYDVKPPSSVNVIERDFEFAVTYPYPKVEGKSEVKGYNPDLYSYKETPKVTAEKTPEIKPDVKKDTKPEKTQVVKKTPEKNVTTPVVKKETPKTETVKKQTYRIFLYKNYYVVNIGSYSSQEAADKVADRYFDLGYNAFVEAGGRRSGNSVYDVIVGDFTSEEFANQFISKYIK